LSLPNIQQRPKNNDSHQRKRNQSSSSDNNVYAKFVWGSHLSYISLGAKVPQLHCKRDGVLHCWIRLQDTNARGSVGMQIGNHSKRKRSKCVNLLMQGFPT
jgi:hypothetical protein